MSYFSHFVLLVLVLICTFFFFFFSSRRRHTRSDRDWSSDVCSSDLNFMDAGMRGLVARHRFQTFRRVKPGKSSTLSYTSATPPTRVISAAPHDGKSKPFEEQVRIRCVAYSDGTVRWREGGAQSDCDDIKKASQARRQ